MRTLPSYNELETYPLVNALIGFLYKVPKYSDKG